MPAERLDERHAAAARHRHPAELDGDRDHPRHEPGRGRVGADAGVEDPRREQPVRLGRGEGLRHPVAAGREHAACELDQPAAAEAAVGLDPEPGSRRRPELRPEHAECEVGVRHELAHGAVPGGTVAGRVALELLDVGLVRGREEDALAVGEERACRQLGVQVLEAARVQLVAELSVGGRAHEERVPRGEDLVREAGLGDLRRPDRAAEVVVALEHEHALPGAGQERGSGERVDAAPDEDDVVAHERVSELVERAVEVEEGPALAVDARDDLLDVPDEERVLRDLEDPVHDALDVDERAGDHRRVAAGVVVLAEHVDVLRPAGHGAELGEVLLVVAKNAEPEAAGLDDRLRGSSRRLPARSAPAEAEPRSSSTR